MKITKYLVAPFYLALTKGTSVFANATCDPNDPTCWTGDGPNTSIPEIVQKVLDFATVFAVVVCVAILIFAGYNYMTANGDENKISKATKSITWAIIGLVVVFAARILIRFVIDKIFPGGGVPTV